jgi:hypothetical protein
MPFIPFPEFRPDVDDFRGAHTQVLSNVLPRGDGYGPMPDLQAYSEALPTACKGLFHARKTDGTIVLFGATATRLYKLDNTALGWVPVSKVTTLTSISNASPGVFTKNSHGLENGDTFVLSTSGALPTGLTAGTVYYVVNKTANTFEASLTAGGASINTSSAGSGTHSMTYKYTSVSSTDNWQFAQFGDNVVAVQANTAPQVYDVETSSAFADLGGSPPNSRYVTVVNRFLVLSGQVTEPTRIQWSGLDAITTWTAGTNFSNYFDAPDGGVARGVAGGEFGLIFQESTIRRMVYVPGASPAFQIERVAEDKGLLGPYSIVRAGERVFFISQQGFQEFFGGVLTPVGKEKVDRTFLADLDTAYLNLLIGASDPSGTRAFWAYKSVGNAVTTHFDKLICYDYGIQRWSPPISINGEFIASVVKPGTTLDALDDISSSIDALPFTLDSVAAAISSRLSGCDDDHQLGFFDGSNLEAILETPEQGLEGKRMKVRGFEPRTDATTVYGSVRHRASAQAALSQTTETLINTQGKCPQRVETKLARGRIRIPAGTLWTNAMGVEPDFIPTGKR